MVGEQLMALVSARSVKRLRISLESIRASIMAGLGKWEGRRGRVVDEARERGVCVRCACMCVHVINCWT